MSYGDVRNVDTTGASAATAGSDGKPAGVNSSKEMAQMDAQRVGQFKANILKVASATGIQAAVIAAIISRETRGGKFLRADGFSANDGQAYGVMQVDKNWHTPNTDGIGSYGHIKQGTDILIGCIGEIRRKFPSWSQNQSLKGGLAAYNMGASRVQSYDQIDAATTGRDYSNDVVARAQWFIQNGY